MFNNEDVIYQENQVINKLKFFREERNLSQLDLSLSSGVSQNMITYIETGKRTPTLKTLIKLCLALGISPVKLFENNIEKEEAKKNVLKIIQKYM
jgi:transcriptional regulator with XRE-family HTH domain